MEGNKNVTGTTGLTYEVILSFFLAPAALSVPRTKSTSSSASTLETNKMSSTAPLPLSFVCKKENILAQLAVPATEYDDLSPKGSIDEGIRDLIDEINCCEGFVTTSSCAGRISVFAEGQKKGDSSENVSVGDSQLGNGAQEDHVDGDEDVAGTDIVPVKLAGVGGKGGGGRWLFVSHEPVSIEGLKEDTSSFLGMKRPQDAASRVRLFREERLIHFKFEPMVGIDILSCGILLRPLAYL